MLHRPAKSLTEGAQAADGHAEPQARYRSRLERIWAAAIAPLRWIAVGLGALILALIVVVLIFDWNWLRGPVGAVASARLHRKVIIAGDLKAHPWSFSPTFEAARVRIAQPAWAGAGDMTDIDRFVVQVKLLPLLRGQVILPLLQADRPQVILIQDKSGRANWDFSSGAKDGKPMKLPAIRHFVINDGRLSVNDAKREITFQGAVSSNEQATGSGRGAFLLTGDGMMNGAKFTARVEGGPLLNVAPDKPYPFKGYVKGGLTEVSAEGRIDKPFDLGRFSTAISVSGRDLNDLYQLTGLALPNTPPYQVSGMLTRNGSRFDFNGADGRIGNSDIHGDLTVTRTADKRPMLQGELSSRKLDFKDLGALFGAKGKRQIAPTVLGQQVTKAAAPAAPQRLLPDATLQTDRVRAMDAKIGYSADAVLAPGTPLRGVSLRIDLDHGLMKIDPLRFQFPRGALAGAVVLNARPDIPHVDADLRLTNARLEDFITAKTGGQPVIEGGLIARAKLSGDGNSVHKAAGDADGTVSLVVPRGEMRQAFAELLGVNASKGLLLLLSKDAKETPLRCAVANFTVKNGVMTADHVVFDTGVVIATGSGAVNLDQERLNLRIEGKPKEARLVRLLAPITLTGPLTAPKIGVEAGPAIGQGGAAAALGALLSPLAAVLPFISPGLADDADCNALLAQAKTAGAPVAGVKTTATDAPAKKAG